MTAGLAGETAVRVTEQAIQILGGNGCTREYPVERWHRDARPEQERHGPMRGVVGTDKPRPFGCRPTCSGRLPR